MSRCKQCAVGLLGACSLDYCQPEREVLIEQARQAAEARAHTLADFEKAKDIPVWQATCTRCGQEAVINLDPATGEPDVYGAAVANDCPAADVSESPASAKQEAPDQAAWYDKLASS